MGRKDQEASSTPRPPQTSSDPNVPGYQPPQVAWEEAFDPVATSCQPGDGSGCADSFRPPFQDS